GLKVFMLTKLSPQLNLYLFSSIIELVTTYVALIQLRIVDTQLIKTAVILILFTPVPCCT
ncbi:hypothetical protein, partial [Flavobacterium sp.]|uniref:hypothetical protein n=1 Tax=Flavobacterium sp. TaxID=239 RepID=UPI004048B801